MSKRIQVSLKLCPQQIFPKLGAVACLLLKLSGFESRISQKYKAKARPIHSSPPKKHFTEFFSKVFKKIQVKYKVLSVFFCFSCSPYASYIVFSILFRFCLYCFSFVLFVWKTRQSAFYSLIAHHYLIFCEKLKKLYQFPTDLW